MDYEKGDDFELFEESDEEVPVGFDNSVEDDEGEQPYRMEAAPKRGRGKKKDKAKDKTYAIRRRIEDLLEVKRLREEGGWFDDDFNGEYEGAC